MPSDTARNWIKTARLCRHGGIAAQLLIVYSPQNLSLNPLMKQIVVKNPHNFVIQFILLQFHSARICAFSSSVNLSSRR